jgi:hypothetical protein
MRRNTLWRPSGATNTIVDGATRPTTAIWSGSESRRPWRGTHLYPTHYLHLSGWTGDYSVDAVVDKTARQGPTIYWADGAVTDS